MNFITIYYFKCVCGWCVCLCVGMHMFCVCESVCARACECECICVHAYVCVYARAWVCGMCMCVCARVGWRLILSVFLYCFPPHSSVTEFGRHWWLNLPSNVTSPQGLADSSGTYEYYMSDFYTDVRDLNSVPHAHMPNSLSTESSPQPTKKIIL